MLLEDEAEDGLPPEEGLLVAPKDSASDVGVELLVVVGAFIPIVWVPVGVILDAVAVAAPTWLIW